ncbi:MAG: hypothetical protein OEZ22_02485 [Spirochaetia bacterium]|nr:hypothetical protein [Spirochaetia bacterium]
MKEAVVITPQETGFGFRLAGIHQISSSINTLSSLLYKLVKEPKYIFLMIDERLIDEDNEEIIKELDETWPGIIVVLPMPKKSKVSEEDYISRIISKAVGYHIRLRE